MTFVSQASEADRSDRPPRGDRPFAWTRWFVVLASLLGLALVFATPMLRGTDEPQHVARLALITEGWVVPPSSDSSPPDYRIDDCLNTYLTRYQLGRFTATPPSWWQQFHNQPCRSLDYNLAPSALAANVYTPVPYVPAIVGFEIGHAFGGPAGSVFGARLFQLAGFIALMAWAIRITPWGRPLLFTIGLLPVVLQGAANVSADPITLALVCSVVALVLRTYARGANQPTSNRHWWVLGGTICALVLCKSAYIPFALLILAIPTAAFGTLRRRIWTGVIILGVAAVLAGSWNIGVVSQISIVGVNQSDSVAAARWIRDHPVGFLEAIVHGWRSGIERTAVLAGFFTPVHRFAQRFPLPLMLGFAWLLVARLVDPVPLRLSRAWSRVRSGSPTTSAETEETNRVAPTDGEDRRDRLVCVGLAVVVAGATVLLIEYGLAIAANPVGAWRIIWVQGRYFLPLLPLTLFGVSTVHARISPRWSYLFPAISTTVLLWWMWWVSHHQWHWL